MPKQKLPVSRFSWLRLRNGKNFWEAELPLQPRVFLVGPSASRKFDPLDVFRFLGDLASEGGGRHTAMSRRGGVKAIRCLAARRHPDVESAVRVASSEAPRICTGSM